MKRLLNSLYILDETAYLTLDGENVVCKTEDNEKFRMPLANVEDIYCFSYVGCSPALMGKCMDNGISISFFSPNGRFQARVQGKTRGNILLRKAQFEQFAKPDAILMQNTMAAKFSNTRYLIKRSLHDNPQLNDDGKLTECIQYLESGIDHVYETEQKDVVMGIEGNCAKAYFDIFDRLILHQKDDFQMVMRTKRPPLDPVNAVLSFLYTIMTSMYASALEGVGLDSCYGYYHALRPGRSSLACDMVEEIRCIAERLVLTMINLKKLNIKDFEKQESGAVYLNKDGKKKVLTAWQEKKRTTIDHPYLGEKIPLGILPYVQSSLLAKYIRGEISEYPCYLLK
ncbi:MAG: type I-C CRISPR-associated endonuclease Cas1c [Ruminococcus sp.]|uniref:type I-C CRISPR-associated endonuclease Cas1c n=1 Tax=Ruminococcus sp. TaxID=41978 RepID=UPI0025E839E7|nr:type I-C CRISPR-associated endonuclease Cas1c [Ruminococcus sp.]MCR5540871.1 type I-C CRISPR-associated endonuclease Cas1c [Ruminococcus sp.]